MQKHLTLANGRKILLNTPEEDVAINAGIAADPDTYELSEDEFKQLKRVGRPIKSDPKLPTTLRLSPDVMNVFRATGKGWQTRIDEALRQYIAEHPLTTNNHSSESN